MKINTEREYQGEHGDLQAKGIALEATSHTVFRKDTPCPYLNLIPQLSEAVRQEVFVL